MPPVTDKRPPDRALAVILELVPGLFVQTFGIGHIYVGRAKSGIALMVTYWLACVLNVLLFHVGIGYFTLPVTWVAYAVVGSLGARRAAIDAARGQAA